jgi:hypothetical protein
VVDLEEHSVKIDHNPSAAAPNRPPDGPGPRLHQ